MTKNYVGRAIVFFVLSVTIQNVLQYFHPVDTSTYVIGLSTTKMWHFDPKRKNLSR